MATNTNMPARGARGAPEFDAKQPRQLLRFFTDLEFHFSLAGVTAEQEKKTHATRYLSVDDQEIWESLDSFLAPHSYASFKADVLKLYPGTDADRRYTLSDLHTLIGEYASVGILSRSDYSEFYRKFLVITKFLVDKARLSTAEQSQAFRRAISPPSLWSRVHQRLQIKKPDVHPDDPYDLTDMNEAMEFVLADSSHGSAISNTASPKPVAVKQEPDSNIAELIESMNGLMKVLAAQAAVTAQAVAAQQSRPVSTGAPSSVQNTPRDLNCSYCGESGHFIIRCPRVDEDTQAGKCKRNVEGQVVLPSGSYVPRRVMGTNLRARIEEWHRQNPGQMAASQNTAEISTHFLSSNSGPKIASSFTLSDTERLQYLEREMMAVRTRAQARAALGAGRLSEPVEEPEQTVRPNSSATSAPGIDKNAPGPAATRQKDPPVHPAAEHPFSKAKDAGYAPPRDRNVGARIPAPPKKAEGAYRTTAPIFDDKIANTVFGRLLESKIEVSERELLSLSPELRTMTRDVTSSRRVVPGTEKSPVAASKPTEQFSFDLAPQEAYIKTIEEQRDGDRRREAFFDSMPTSFGQATLPANATVIPDHFET
ncbi:unnamed protein product [Mycena citricolor]|uniref:CCHC-type domain-containing protein n=1 Tax=Mycena citricolor TaxID=2018698 RepID=A0AAD2HG32_9AGAR|nr:unnamed protein product [Mycena citricolor]